MELPAAGLSPPPPLDISPPLVNSSNPWATTREDLAELYACPYIGAVTTRTSLLEGFPNDSSVHQYALFDPLTQQASRDRTKLSGREAASLNSFGYSPYKLDAYLGFIKSIATFATSPSSIATPEPADLKPESGGSKRKGFIISVTGTPDAVAVCYRAIARAQLDLPAVPLAMEINLSCPNIPDKPPPAYSRDALVEYLLAVDSAIASSESSSSSSSSPSSSPRIPVGLKTPPYTHADQFRALIEALVVAAAAADGGGGGKPSAVSFITAINTLGSCLVIPPPHPDAQVQVQAGISPAVVPVLPGAGLGGMAGAPLHPLALGNVATLRRMLDEDGHRGRLLGHIQIIGTGGVLDAAGCARMKAVGASIVGVGTALGLRGVGVFREIAEGL